MANDWVLAYDDPHNPLDTCSGSGILIYCVSSVVILSFSFSFFHSSFIQCYPLGSSYLVEKVLSIGI